VTEDGADAVGGLSVIYCRNVTEDDADAVGGWRVV
jgi:hypothetical protein